MFGIGYNLIKTPYYNDDGTATYCLQHHTFLFHTFMMMNLFNMFNCRKLGHLGDPGDPEFNVFEGIHRNWWFLIVWLIEVNVQFIMVESRFGMIFVTTPLTIGMHATALIFGIGSLGVGAAVKKTPPEWLDLFPTLNESEEEGASGLQTQFNDAFQTSKTE